MNLINLSILVGLTLVIVFLSKNLGELFRCNPWIIGIVLGCATLFALTINKLFQTKNALPKCEAGRCGPRDYTGIGLAKDLGIGEKGLVLKCRCGRLYLQVENQLFSIDENKNVKKYKIRRNNYSGWVDDK